MSIKKRRFDGLLVGRGPKSAWVFLDIPFDVHEAFGSKARVAVAGEINGYPFNSSLLPNGDGTHSLPMNKELLAGAGAKAGDTVSVVLAPDTIPRQVEIPDDLAEALKAVGTAREVFGQMSYSHKKEYVDWIIAAKKPETRARRIAKTVQMVIEGKRLKS